MAQGMRFTRELGGFPFLAPPALTSELRGKGVEPLPGCETFGALVLSR